MHIRKLWKERIGIIVVLILGMIIIFFIHKHVFYIENVIYRRSLYVTIAIIIGLFISKIKKKTKS